MLIAELYILHLVNSKTKTFPTFFTSEQTQRNEVEVRVDNFIQITVCGPAKPRVGAFVCRNAERSIAKSLLKLCFVAVYVTKKLWH